MTSAAEPADADRFAEARGLTRSIRTLQGHVEQLADRRARVVATLREAGIPVPQIAVELGASPQAVYTWKPKGSTE